MLHTKDVQEALVAQEEANKVTAEALVALGDLIEKLRARNGATGATPTPTETAA